MYRKNVSGQNLSFVMISTTTGAALTGLTVSGYRCIDGGTQASVTGTISEKANGQYNLALSQADTNGDNIGYLFTGSGAIPTNIDIITTNADPTSGSNFGLSAIPTAAPGASSGLLIAGANASFTCTGAFTVSDGIIVTASTTNRSAFKVTGNGTGNGFHAIGGATGSGIKGESGATSGKGMVLSGGTNGLYINGIDGDGVQITSGATDGTGMLISGSSSGNGIGLKLEGFGTASAFNITGKMSISDGVTVSCSTADRSAIVVTGNGAGHGVQLLSGSGSTSNGLYIAANSTNGHGIFVTGNGNGSGLRAVGGSGGLNGGIYATGYGGGAGMILTGEGNSHGLYTSGGSSSGHGIYATCLASAAHGIRAESNGGGTGSGLYCIAIGGSGSGATFTKTGSGHDINASLFGSVESVINGVSLATNDSPVIQSGTAQGGSSSTITLSSGASGTNDIYTGLTIKLTGGTGNSQVRVITNYNGSTKVATIYRSWQTNPDSGTTYALLATDTAKVNGSLEVVASSVGGTTFPANFSVFSIDASGRVDVAKIAGTSQTARDIGANVLLSSGTGTGQISLSSGLVDITQTAADKVWSTATRVLTAGTNIVLAKGTGVTGFNDVSATQVENAVWDAARSSHVTASTFGIAAQIIRDGTAQAGASTTITLDSGASSSNSFYNNCLIKIIGGTGVAQSRFITGYVGSTKVATVNSAWVTNPDSSSVFVIEYFDAIPGASAPTAAQVATAVWQDTTSGDFTVSGSIGKSLFTSGNAPGTASGLGLTQTFPTNFSSLSIDGSGRVDIGKILGTASQGAAGYVGVDWSKITNNTSTVSLSGTTVGTITTYTGDTPQTGDSFARLGAPAGANIAADIAAITSSIPTLQSGTATAGGSNTITIQTALGTDNLPNGCIIYISSGTGAKQARVITGYVNSTKVVTVDRNWTTNPDNTSVYTIAYNHLPAVTTSQKITGVATTDLATTVTNLTNAATSGDLTSTMKTSVENSVWDAARSSHVSSSSFGQFAQLSRSGTAQAGASGTITLDASANSNNNFYNNCLVEIISGTGVSQSRFVTAYNGTSKVATVNSNWVTNPDNTSVFNIRYFDAIPGATAPTAAQVATAVWQDLTAGSDFSTVNSIGALLKGFTFTVAGYVDANTLKVGGTTQTARDLGASVLLSPGTGTGQLDITSGVVKANATQILGTAVSTPATAGILDVNVKNINNVATATPGASGGILISGSNSGTTTLAALTITGATTHTGNVSMAAGLNITQSSSNTSALVITGNGTGHGAIITSGSGATGDGVRMVSAATDGNGLVLTATGTGKDLKTTNTSTNIVLAKTTNITGFNDIAATAIVSSGAITTSGGAVSTVTTVTNLTNAPTAGDLTATMKTSVAAAVWDAARSSYVTANSFGRALQISRDGTAQAGAGTTITLDASANANNSFYNNCLVEIIGGTGIGQSRFITGYVGSTKVATINSSWVTNPDNTSVFVIKYFDQVPGASAPTAAQVATAVWQDTTSSDFTTSGSIGQALFNYGQYVRRGTAQAGASTTITLDASASSTDDIYNYELIEIIGGTGVGQGKFITDYVGSTKVATVDSAWAVNPDNTSVFLIKFFSQIPGASAPTAAQVATAVWQDATGGDFTVSGSIGKSLFTSGNVPGAAGGLFISGTNSSLTITGSTTLSDGLIVNRSTSNASAIVATGNGSGSAVLATGGTTGDAVKLVGGPTSGRGLSVTTTDGYGIYVSALGSTGAGIVVFSDATDGITVRGGTTGGNALTLLARGGNAAGFSCGGNGSGRGIVAQGGTTGIGFLVSGGSSSGDAVVFQTTDGHALKLDATGTGKDFFLDNQTTNIILEKDTNITGFNDLAATDITSTGAPITLTAGFVESDVKAIDGSTNAATKQSAAARAVVSGSVTGASSTTTIVSSDLSSSETDNYVGRVVVLLSGTMAFQASTITDFNPGTDTITVEGFTSAPAAAVTFIIV